MADESEFQEHKEDFLDAAAELGLRLDDADVEKHLRRTQARAQEHEVPMGSIERENLRRALTDPIPPENDPDSSAARRSLARFRARLRGIWRR